MKKENQLKPKSVGPYHIVVKDNKTEFFYRVCKQGTPELFADFLRTCIGISSFTISYINLEDFVTLDEFKKYCKLKGASLLDIPSGERKDLISKFDNLSPGALQAEALLYYIDEKMKISRRFFDFCAWVLVKPERVNLLRLLEQEEEDIGEDGELAQIVKGLENVKERMENLEEALLECQQIDD